MSGISSGLRILAIAPTSFFADYGCHVRILQQTLALQSRGDEVRILTYPTGRDISSVQMFRAPGWPGLRNPQIGPRPAKIPLDASLLLYSHAHARRWQPDVVLGYLHEGAWIGSRVARSLKAPMVFDYQGSLAGELAGHGWLKFGGLAYHLVQRVEKAIHRRSDAILCSSLHSAAALKSDGDCRRIIALPDCVDTDFFDPARIPYAARQALRTRLGIPPDRKVVAYLGLLGEQQGISHLLRVAAGWPADAPSVHFLVMGYPRLDAYRRLAADMHVGERVTFIGKVPYEDAPLYLSLGDIAVAPKVSDTEGHGKLLNYMAMQLPTASFDTPVSREYLDGLGWYAPLGDSQMLTRRLDELIRAEDRDALGKALRRRAQERYSCGAMGEALESALTSFAQTRTDR